MPSGTGGLLHFVGQRSVRGQPFGGAGDELRVRDVRAIYRLLRVINRDLARRSVSSMRGPDFDRLEWLLEVFTSPDLTVEESESVHRAFVLGLMQNQATHPEMAMIGTLSDLVGRHYRAGMRRLGLRPNDLPRWGDRHRATLAEFRQGDPELAARAVMRLADRTEAITMWIAPPRVKLL